MIPARWQVSRLLSILRPDYGQGNRYRDHIDPEYQHGDDRILAFLGRRKCARLIRMHKARGAWADIIVGELAENAAGSLAELIETFRTDPSDEVRLYVVMALDMARLPETVPFLAEVFRGSDPRLMPMAEQQLLGNQ